jgi:hypothetical protein
MKKGLRKDDGKKKEGKGEGRECKGRNGQTFFSDIPATCFLDFEFPIPPFYAAAQKTGPYCTSDPTRGEGYGLL